MSAGHRTLVCALAIALLVAWPAAAGAQSLCQPTESIQTCWDRLEDAMTNTAVDAAAKQQSDVKKVTETGLSGVSGLSSSVKDFLPLLDVAGLLGPAQKDEKSGAITVALNTKLLLPDGATDDPQLQIKAVIETAPKMFSDLKKLVPEQNRDAVEKQLLSARKDTNNFLVSLSYNFTGLRVGRAFGRYDKRLNLLFGEAVRTGIATARNRRAALTREIIAIIGNDVSLDETPWVKIPEGVRARVEPVLYDAVRSDIALNAALGSVIKASGLHLFGQLVNNQPQVSVTATRTVRDDLFGPEVTTGRISIELGLGNNLNAAFKKHDEQQCEDDPAACLAELAAFAKDPETQANIKNGSRFAFFAEVVYNAAYSFSHPAANLALDIPSGTGVTAGLDYGRLFGVDDAGAAEARVDASIRFEHPSYSEAEDRFVASLTVTKKVAGFSIPLGIVYANKPKFLGEVDYGLSATVGLKFNLFTGTK